LRRTSGASLLRSASGGRRKIKSARPLAKPPPLPAAHTSDGSGGGSGVGCGTRHELASSSSRACGCQGTAWPSCKQHQGRAQVEPLRQVKRQRSSQQRAPRQSGQVQSSRAPARPPPGMGQAAEPNLLPDPCNPRYTAASPSAGSNPALTNTAGLNRPKQRATPKITISGCSDDTNFQGNYRGTGVYVATSRRRSAVGAAVRRPSARPYAEGPPVSMY